MPLDQPSANHSSVVEFANIIATLHNSESSCQSQSPTPGPSPLPFVPLSTTIMTTSLKDLIPHFFGRDINDEGGQEDPAESIDNLNFAIDGQSYTDENRKLTATRVIFLSHLRDKALLWYHSLNAETRANWQLLETAFLSRFALAVQKRS